MEYATVRLIHISCAGINLGLFMLRGVWQLRGGDWRAWRCLRFVPHINDSLLLGGALGMAAMTGQYPLAQAWLSAKVLALAVYIGAGTLALNPRFSYRMRLIAFCCALCCVAYIGAVALTRSPVLGLL